jgi:TonB family protein
MVLKFKCEKCGGEIVVKYLKPGEEALCRRCGAHVAVPGPEEIAKGAARAFELRCGQCGAAVDAAGLKPGETAPCPSCGAAVIFPDYSEAEKGRRLGRFVPCPACGSDKYNVVSFWGIPWFLKLLLPRRKEAVPVKCTKCGARFDGLTGRSVDDVMDYARTIRFVYLAVALLVAFVLTICSTLDVPRVLATHRVLTCERKGDLFLKSIDHEEALKWYERGLDVDPERYSLHYGKAKALRGMARYEEAVAAFDRAAELKPDDWLAPYYKAEILADLGRREEAVESYGRALKFLDDEYPETRYRAYWGQIRALKRLGRTEEALETYDEALLHFPEDGFLRRSKARYLIELGRYEDPALGSLRRREAVTLILDERGKEIPRIAKKYLGTAPSSGSSVTVRFKVAASGAVTACSVESSAPGNAAMEREVRRHVMAWRFPPGDGEVLTFTHRSALKRVDSD